ncbi:MAG: hypothetical protein GY778_13345 [bacterium]|nr:hypothetical protein [bacterium]
MPDPQETEEQRRRRLDELELFEKTQDKLLAWAKRRFWWIAALGSLALGSGGYGLVHSMLRDTRDASTQAMLKAGLAAGEATEAAEASRAASSGVAAALEAANTAKTTATDVLESAEQLNVRTGQLAEQTAQLDQRARELEQRTSELDQRAKQIQVANDEALRVAQLLQQKLDELDRQGRQIADAHDRLYKEFDTARRGLQAQVAGMRAQVDEVREVADPEDKSLKALLQRLNDSSLPLRERTAAATALAQRGADAKSAIDDLKTAFRSVRPTELRSEEHSFAQAVASAIARVGGESSLNYLFDVMVNPNASFEQHAAAGGALRAVPIWSTRGIAILRERFDSLESHNQSDIVEVFAWDQPAFANATARAPALDLLIHAVQVTCTPASQLAAFGIEECFSQDGEKALPVLRDELNRRCDDENVRRAIQDAINAIEGEE